MTDDAPLTKQDIIDAIDAAASNQGQGIGLPKGARQQGIHVPPGHRAPTPVTQYGTPVRPSPYQPGDEQQPGGGSQADILRAQGRLIEAGLLKPTDVRPGGVWDAKSAAAYRIVLGFANVHGMNAKDAMDYFMANPANVASTTPSQTTNPITVSAAVRGGGPNQSNTARELLGKDLSPSETADFAKWYQDQEETARANYLKADLAGAQTAQAAPDLTAAAEQYITQHRGGDAQAYGTASRMFSFFDLLKGPV